MSKGNEQWRRVVGSDGYYEVSSLGRVRSVDRKDNRGRFLKGRVIKQVKSLGYCTICIHIDGNRKQARVHRLVLEAFVGPCPDGMEACHNDGCKTHNYTDNLRWDTRVNNHADKAKHGTLAKGEKHGRCRLEEHDVHAIRELADMGYGCTRIKRRLRLNVGESTIGSILNGRNWAWLKTPNKNGGAI